MVIRTLDDRIISAYNVDSIYTEYNKDEVQVVGVKGTKKTVLGSWAAKGVAQECFCAILENFSNSIPALPQGVLDIKQLFPKDKATYNKERVGQPDTVVIHGKPTPAEEEKEAPSKE